MTDTLEDLINALRRNRKFAAKLERVAAETKKEPSVVVDEGVELVRKRFRLFNGALAKRLQDPEKIEHYSAMQSMAAQMTAENMSEADLKQRGIAGAKARAENLKKKKKKPGKSTTPNV